MQDANGQPKPKDVEPSPLKKITYPTLKDTNESKIKAFLASMNEGSSTKKIVMFGVTLLVSLLIIGGCWKLYKASGTWGMTDAERQVHRDFERNTELYGRDGGIRLENHKKIIEAERDIKIAEIQAEKQTKDASMDYGRHSLKHFKSTYTDKHIPYTPSMEASKTRNEQSEHEVNNLRVAEYGPRNVRKPIWA